MGLGQSRLVKPHTDRMGENLSVCGTPAQLRGNEKISRNFLLFILNFFKSA